MNALYIIWAIGYVVSFVPWARSIYNRVPRENNWKEGGMIPRHHVGWALAVAILYSAFWPLFLGTIALLYVLGTILDFIEHVRPLQRAIDWIVGR